ncbi:hypothetical protein EDD93_3666 [Streptomyces sp. 840.1]|uniref:hypothetical protein n=1 Tax=Streptomyces sp. 840.1 TaxID=2485152 RepID=UPI000F93929D|nr:hypothetical protein [Streptomyces sp. 840.1]ROQ69169.1 hypothetical protein EDD93_3666 [Streptomyces sp. 840.1]
MANRLTFLLDGRDHLSRVLDGAGRHANRLGRDLLAASINGDAAMRRLATNTTTSMASMQRDTDLGAKAGEALKGTLISLAPAAIPAAASLAPLAAGAGAVAVATLAFTGALIPQISALTEAGEAQKKYDDAVAKSGRTSEAAITAQLEYQHVMADLPPETRKAAVALGLLKDSAKAWSDSLAGDTMPAFTKGLAVANALLPKTEGLVKGTGRELDRMMTALGGAMESPGLDRLNSKFTTFANTTLRKVDDQLIHLMRVSDSGKVGGGFSEFMDYARAQGPVVAETVSNVARALTNLLQAGSDVGVGMLDIVNALSGIVSAVPPDAIAVMLQLALAIKAVKLAAVGVTAARTAMAAFAAQLVAMQAAAAGAPGRLAAVTAGIGAMSRGAKIAAAGTGIGLLVIGLMELSQQGKAAPPDIDKMTSSLGRFADSGKVAGETARVFGNDLSGLMASLSVMGAKNADDFFKRFDKNPVGIKEAKKEIEALDKSLAGLVQGGKADLAAAALARIKKQMGQQGFETSGLSTRLTEYKEALADAAFEQQLAAQSMGLFGTQALQVQQKLDAQKASADGLRQSIQALNDVNRQGLGGMIGFEAAIDAAAKAAKDNAGALDMTNGRLNLNSEKSRNAASALNDLASKTDEATAAARQSGASWSTVNGIYARGRERLLASAQAMGLTKSQAQALAAQILKTPDKTAKLKGNLEDLQAKLADAKKRLAAAPSSKTAKIRGEISDLRAKVSQARYALDTVHSKTVSVMVQYRSNKNPSSFAQSIGGYASGGKPQPGELAWVGEEGPELMRFGGGGTEVYSHGDSMAMVSDASRAGRDAGLGLRAGMTVSTGGVEAGGRGLGAAVLSGIRDELEIHSPSKKTKALAADAGKGLIIGLTGSKGKISAVSRDLVRDIWAAWRGSRTTKDSRLVAMVNTDTRRLQVLAKKRDDLAAKIATAKKYAATVRTAARQETTLGQLGIADGEVSAGSIKAGLQQKLAQIKTFTSYIDTLAKRGLSKGMIRQILDMGPEQGYAYASALAGASSSTLKSINATQTSLDTATTSLGRAGADALYDSGTQAGKGFLRGLTSQQDAIEKQMTKIAQGMQKAIKKALGIKSPSTVMAQLGRYSTEGLARGLTQPMPVLDAALGVVSGRVAGVRPVIGRSAVVGGGGGSSITVNVDARGAMDPVAVGREVERIMVKFGRSQGRAVAVAR